MAIITRSYSSGWGISLLVLAYIVIGAFVAGTRGYFGRAGEFEGVISAILAMFLWPLVLLGVQFNVGA